MAVAERARGLGMTLLGSDPVRDRGAGRAARRRARDLRGAAGAVGRGHGPRAAHALDHRAHRREGDRPHEAGRVRAQRRPRRDRRRGRARRGAARGPPRRRRRSTSSRPSRRPARRSSTRPNTVLTPHLGASTAEAQVAVAEEIAEQVLDVLEGRPARYAVNAPLLSAEAEQTIGPYLPLAETLGRFLAQFARGGRRHVHRRAGRRARPERVGAAHRRRAARPARDGHDGARQPRQRRRSSPRRGGSPSSSAGRPTPAGSAPRSRCRARCAAGTSTVGGTLAGGEMRLVRLNDYRLDMAADAI